MRKIFSNDEIEALKKNPFVLECSEKWIAYTFDFKKYALEEYSRGVSTREIWRRAGFDIRRWNHDYPKDCLKRWRKMVKKNGLESLTRMQGVGATGRPKTKGVTEADRIKRLELQVRYLEAENAFLAQLRAKRAESNSGHNKNSKSLEK